MSEHKEQKSLRELMSSREKITSEIDALKQQLSRLDCVIIETTRQQLESMYALSGKQSGTVRVAGEGGIQIKGDIPKKVEWDGDALMAAAGSLPWETVSKLFDIKITVPEKSFQKLNEFGLPEELVSAINRARTVKYGELKVSLEGE